MSRLPIPGSDTGLWGEILNDFLLREHSSNGALKIRTDGTFEPSLAKGDVTQYLRGDKTWQKLDKQAVGLPDVDNTADVDKPISTATQAVLDSKMDKSGGNLDGDIIIKTKTLSTKDNGTNAAVGIGTDAPTSVVGNRAVLDIEDGDGSGAELRLNSINAQGRFYNSNTQFGFGTDTAHALGIYTNGGGNARIFITPDGAIGLNTVNPTHSLTLPSTASGIAYYNTSDQTANYERFRQYWSNNTYYIKTEYGGTGAGRNLVIGSASSSFLMRYFQDASGSYDLARNLNNANVTHTRISGTMTQSSGSVTGILISPTINQSSTAGYTALLINPTESATGSGAKNLIDAQVGGASKFKVDNVGSATTTGICHAITTKATNYTATAADYTILGNAASSGITINLPAAASNTGRVYNIKKIDSSANTVTIDANNSETIDGALTKVITAQYGSVTVQCDGTKWWIL